MSRRITALLVVSIALAASQPVVLTAQVGPAAAVPPPWSPQALEGAGGQGDATVPEPGYVEDQLLVRFKPSATEAEKRAMHARYGAQVVGEVPALGVQVLRVPTDALYSVSAYQASSTVAYAEPNYLAEILGRPDGAAPRAGAPVPLGPQSSLAAPNDPLYSQQWHHATIRSSQGWDETHAAAVTIAIVDTGVVCSHPDLSGKCVPGYDFVNNDSDPRDDHGHGTHVAGIAAAMTNNGVGIAGVGYDARIMPMKALGASGNGSHSAIASAITWATDRGAHVINMSLGAYFTSSTLRDAVAYAISRGVSVVAAAGNDNSSNPNYPSSYPDVIGVAATTQSDTKASFSNYGQNIDVAAPGVGILSSVMSGSYQAWSGTSMASPVVAGAAALLRAQRLTRTPNQIEALLEVSAVDLGPTGWDPEFGAGRIDVGAALAREPGSGIGPEQTPIPSATVVGPTIGPPTASPTTSTDFVQQVEDLINQRRASFGLAPLRTNAALRLASDVHVADMAGGGFCGHGGSNGSTPYDRMRDAGYSLPYGEIVACGQTTPASVVQAWMASTQGHREMILCSPCTELGAGYRRGSGGFVHYWTVDFGSRAVGGPTPTVSTGPTPGPSATAAPPTATRTPVPPTPTSLPGGVEVVLTPANNRVGWVVSSQPGLNYFDDDDMYTGTWNGNIYHGAAQIDLGPVPAGAHLNYARLELTGRSSSFLGASGTWSANVLDSAIDAGFGASGYAQIHTAAIDATLLPLLGIDDLGPNVTNTFNFSPSQLGTLAARVDGSRRLSLRLDGPTGGTFSNLFTWDTGYGPESFYPGPKLVVNYSLTAPTPAPTATPTDVPPPSPTSTEGATPTATETAVPSTATSTAPPPPPTATPTSTEPPPPPTAEDPGGAFDLVPLASDMGWVVQNQVGNHFGDVHTYTGYYHGLVYRGAVQFDLGAIPPGSVVRSARLTLTGQSTRYLSVQGNGLWRVKLLKPAIDAGWRGHGYGQIDGAEAASSLQPEMRQGDLDVGRRNVFVFSTEQLRELERRAATTRRVSFRFDGPSIGLSNVFDWSTGYGVNGAPPVLSVVIGPPGSGEPQPTEPPQNRDLALAAIAAINRERLRAGVVPLALGEEIMAAARAHNDDMIANRFFSHTGSDGSTPAQRVARTGFNAASVGEVLAALTPDVQAVVDAWMAREQRDQLLDPAWTHVGAHYRYQSQTAYGHYWTVDFARQAP